MRELIVLLQKHLNGIIFLMLELCFLGVYIQNNRYPYAVFSEQTLAWTSSIKHRIFWIEKYLNLPQQNEELAKENALLRMGLMQYQGTEMLPIITLNHQVIPARVIHRKYHQQVQWLTLNRGRKSGVLPQMGVITAEGIVGVVTVASENYALVRTILDHSPYPFSPMVYLPEIRTYSTLHWTDPENYQIMVLKDIPYHLPVFVGMKVYSSDESLLFVEQLPIGEVEQIALDPTTHRYELQVRLFLDFRNIRHVYVVQPANQEEYHEIQDFLK